MRRGPVLQFRKQKREVPLLLHLPRLFRSFFGNRSVGFNMNVTPQEGANCFGHSLQGDIPGVTHTDMQDFFIDFDGAQVRCRTDVPDVAAFIRKMFSEMLVSGSVRPAGQVELLRTKDGFAIDGGESFVVEGDQSGMFDQLRHEVMMTFIRARRDLMWIHSGAVRRGSGAILVAGPSGAGKSTLVIHLVELGWRYLSDDAAPLSVETAEVLPYPQTPRRRVNPGRAVAPDEGYILERELKPVPAGCVWRERSPVAHIVFVEFSFAATADIRRLTPGETSMKLIRNCTNFVDHKEGAVAGLTNMARSVPGYALKYGDSVAATGLIESLVP